MSIFKSSLFHIDEDYTKFINMSIEEFNEIRVKIMPTTFWGQIAAAAAILVSLILLGNFLVFKSLVRAKPTHLKFSLAPVLIVVVSPVLIFLLPSFFVYRLAVHITLWRLLGNRYGGMVEGRDGVYNLENENPVHILMLVTYQGPDFFKHAKEVIGSTVENHRNSNVKIFGTIHEFMGYFYILKDQLRLDDCIRKMKSLTGPLNKDDFLVLMSDYTSTPLPMNRQALWDVFIGSHLINWGSDEGYPILLRLNHTFGDGAHILTGICRAFADRAVEVPAGAHILHPEQFPFTEVRPCLAYWCRSAMFYFKQIWLSVLCPSVGLLNSALMADDTSALHGPEPSYRKHFYVEGEDRPDCVALIKRIKQKFPGSSFEDVLLAAIAASFNEYFQNKSERCPPHIVVEVPAVPFHLVGWQWGATGKARCSNRLTFAVRKLPMGVDVNRPSVLLKLLKFILRQGVYIKRSLEHEINYHVLLVICHLVPATILRPFFKRVHRCTAMMSNLPGPAVSIRVMGDCRVVELLGWAATRGYTGIGFVIFTYEDRLQLSMVADKAVMHDRSDGHVLMKGIFKYLRKFDEEVENITTSMLGWNKSDIAYR